MNNAYITLFIVISIFCQDGMQAYSRIAQESLRSTGSFSFVPPIVPFDQGLSIRPKEIPFPSRIKNLAQEYITNPLPYSIIIDKFRALYIKNSQALLHPQKHVTIPKVIHQIWVTNPIPEKYKQYIASWLTKHPTWDYILWTDLGSDPCPDLAQQFPHYRTQSIRSFGPLKNQTLYDTAHNPAQKSDLFRYELLEKQGGVYVDCDVESFQPLDILHHSYDFYAGIEPVECGRLIGNAIIAAKPHHPIMQECITSVTTPEKCNAAKRYGRTMTIVCATGPMILTGACYRKAGHDTNIDILFPTSYFYPCGLRKPQAPLKPESFAAHYWTLTWAGVKR